jgi:hypothetical protein
MVVIQCRHCGLVGSDLVCEVCRAELSGASLLTRDLDMLAAFLRLVLYGEDSDAQRRAA